VRLVALVLAIDVSKVNSVGLALEDVPWVVVLSPPPPPHEARRRTDAAIEDNLKIEALFMIFKK